MNSTDDLIASLSAQLTPVRRLLPPPLRTFGCLVFATAVIGFLVLLRSLRSDFSTQIHDPTYLVQLGAAWLTGAIATLSAFETSLPDRSRKWLFAPIPSVVLWLYGLEYGCLAHWIAIPLGAPIEPGSVSCLETIVFASVPVSLALWVMLRRSRPLRPGATLWMGGLAVAAFANTAHLLINVVQASLLVLVMNLVPVMLIMIAFRLSGRSAIA